MMRLSYKTAMTLLELTMATVLLTIVMSAVMAFSLAFKRLQSVSSKGSVVVARLSSAFADLSTTTSKAIGCASLPGFVGDVNDPTWFAARLDTNNNFEPDNTDRWTVYFLDVNSGDFFKCRNALFPDPSACGAAQTELMLRNVDPASAILSVINNARVEVDLTIRFDDRGAHVMENPEYHLKSIFSSASVVEN